MQTLCGVLYNIQGRHYTENLSVAEVEEQRNVRFGFNRVDQRLIDKIPVGL